MTDPHVITTLAKIQDDVVYVIESLLEGFSGEAKSEMADIVERFPAQAPLLGEVFARQLRPQLAQALELLQGREREAAVTLLIGMRRGLRNCLLRLQGMGEVYPYGAPFYLEGEQLSLQ